MPNPAPTATDTRASRTGCAMALRDSVRQRLAAANPTTTSAAPQGTGNRKGREVLYLASNQQAGHEREPRPGDGNRWVRSEDGRLWCPEGGSRVGKSRRAAARRGERVSRSFELFCHENTCDRMPEHRTGRTNRDALPRSHRHPRAPGAANPRNEPPMSLAVPINRDLFNPAVCADEALDER